MNILTEMGHSPHMSQNIFFLIKACALILNNLFYSVELLTFSPVVNAQC